MKDKTETKDELKLFLIKEINNSKNWIQITLRKLAKKYEEEMKIKLVNHQSTIIWERD